MPTLNLIPTLRLIPTLSVLTIRVFPYGDVVGGSAGRVVHARETEIRDFELPSRRHE